MAGGNPEDFDLNLQTYITTYNATYKKNSLDRYNFKKNRFGLLNTLLSQQDSPNSIITPEVRELIEKSYGQTVEIPVMNNDLEITLGDKRTCTITCPNGSTAKVQISTVAMTADICIAEAILQKNQISADLFFARQYEAMIKAFGTRIESMAIAALELSKSSVYGATNVVGDDGFIPLVGDTMQVPVDEIPTFWNWFSTIQEEDGYDDMTNIIGSPTLNAQVQFLRAQGEANNTNYAFQFNNWNFDFTTSIKDDVGMLGTGFVFPEGSVAIVTQNAPHYLSNSYASKDGINYYTRELAEFPGMRFDVMHYTECTDFSSIPGLEAFTNVVGEKWQFAINVSVVTPYIEDLTTMTSPIRKFELVNSKITPTPPVGA